MSSNTPVNPAPAVDYFTPEQLVAPGTFFPQKEGEVAPKIFQPLKIRGLTLPNRLGVSPMCQYSANSKFEATPYHLIHYGQLSLRGPGIIIVEATSVSEVGGLSPQDLAIYNDEQAKSFKPIVDFAHSQGGLIAIQIAHGGRKASGQPLYVHLEQTADESVGGWPDKIVAPSAIPFREHGNLHTPRALTIPEIKTIVKEFGEAAKRAVEISGFDAVEIHGAHGYLISEFLSSTSNKRTDEYGGSFENRIKFLLEVIDSVRSNIPESVPLFLRFSASENSDVEGAWNIEDSIKLSKIVIEKGVDLLDVSSGGNSSAQVSRKSLVRSNVPAHLPFSKAIKEAVGDKALVSCVEGLHNKPEEVNQYLEDGLFDLALAGRGFLRNPGLVWEFADKLGVRVHQARQYQWGFYPAREQIQELIKRTEELKVKA
ncbi:NADH:flavin oxidoreductase/12-oxophytodienoate reductase [Scheffersomyces coipomensis]|uniref:NADH:flavin oxidoreductase/12-oxophytodienoate reductase n=1 Tax=Scheffersomyces coipomensis TaxID=1788519 RepID=UPI00315CA52C